MKAFNKFEGLLFLSKYSGARTRGFFLLISSILSLTRLGHSICNVCNLRCYLVCKLTNVRLSSENSSQDCFLSSSPHTPTIKKHSLVRVLLRLNNIAYATRSFVLVKPHGSSRERHIVQVISL